VSVKQVILSKKFKHRCMMNEDSINSKDKILRNLILLKLWMFA